MTSDDDDKPIEQSDNTLVRLINTMIIEAHSRGVSDIHVESQPRRAKVRIRFRKDGMLSPYLELPHTYRAALVARLKIMADLDISERRKPQDGKIDFSKFSDKHRLELRIATIPTANGLEDVVMRLLTSAKPIAMDKLRLSEPTWRSCVMPFPALWHGAVCGAHRLGQNHHAAFGTELSQHARAQDLDRRRPD